MSITPDPGRLQPTVDFEHTLVLNSLLTPGVIQRRFPTHVHDMDIDDHRRRVLVFMKLLASTDALERLVGSADSDAVADHLCGLWIDEIYVPGIRYRDGLKGDRDAADVARFERAFSQTEKTILEQFHRFLELRLEMLPKRLPEERAFPRGAFWQSIVGHAGRVLEEIDPEGLETDELVWSTAEWTRPSGYPVSISTQAGSEKNGEEGED